MPTQECQLCQEEGYNSRPAVRGAETLSDYWAYVCQYHYENDCYQVVGLSTVLKED
jgi:hypothetical protein